VIRILKMLLLHRQAVLVRIGGKLGDIVTWADVLDLRKTKEGSVRHPDREP
jgi:predicted transcriptional regulator